MKEKQLHNLVERYRLLMDREALMVRTGHYSSYDYREKDRQRIRKMLNTIDKLIDNGHTMMAVRKIGFVQGILWTNRKLRTQLEKLERAGDGD